MLQCQSIKFCTLENERYWCDISLNRSNTEISLSWLLTKRGGLGDCYSLRPAIEVPFLKGTGFKKGLKCVINGV